MTLHTVVLENKHPFLAFIGGCSVLLGVLVIGGGTALVLLSENKAPAFTVITVTRDDGCTVIGDYCMRAHCTVNNPGSKASEQPIVAELFSKDDGHVVARRTAKATLLSAAATTLTFNFPEASLDSNEAVRCSTPGP